MPQEADLIRRAGAFHPWDAMAPAALSAIVKRGRPSRLSVEETGCGGSTIVLSQISRQHIAFAIDGENRTITELRAHPSLKPETVTFVEGETRQTVPRCELAGEIDMLLPDGPHAYPLPQVEFAYLYPHLKTGGWIVIDDGPAGWRFQPINRQAVFRYSWRDQSRELLRSIRSALRVFDKRS